MPETCVIGFVKRWLLAVLAITFYFSRGTTRGQHDEFIHELFTHAFASTSGIISWKYFHVLELDLRENVTLNQTK